MRIILTCIGAVALSACSQQAEEAEPVTEEVVEETAAMTFDGGPAAGTYEATSSEGVVISQDLTEDGAFTNTQDGEVVLTGTYEMSEGSKICFSNEEADEPACYLPSDIAEDGSWTATREGDDTETWTVRRTAS